MPLVEALVYLPRFRLVERVWFLVDTGADDVYLMPSTVRVLESLRPVDRQRHLARRGGHLRRFPRTAMLVFNEPGRGGHIYLATLGIASRMMRPSCTSSSAAKSSTAGNAYDPLNRTLASKSTPPTASSPSESTSPARTVRILHYHPRRYARALWFLAGPNNSWNDTLALAQHAESRRWHGVWYATTSCPTRRHQRPHSECWTTLAALGAAVPRVHVGALVTGNTYRHPTVSPRWPPTWTTSPWALRTRPWCWLAENEHRLRHQFSTLGGRMRRFEEPAR